MRDKELVKTTYIKIIEFMLITAPDGIVQVVSMTDDSKSFIGIIPMKAVCIRSQSLSHGNLVIEHENDVNG